MEENNKRENNLLEEYKAKQLIYYEHLLDSWITARLEHDKSLLLIATGAIGLLVTLVTTLGLPAMYYLVFYIVALGGFMLSAVSVTSSFKVHAEYIKAILDENDIVADLKNKQLLNLANISKFGFSFGVLFSLIVLIATAIYKF